MTNGNEPITPHQIAVDNNGNVYSSINYSGYEGLTKLEYFACEDDTPIPYSFCNKKLREFNEIKKCVRVTDDHPFTVMSTEEIIETRMSWKVMCAKALINELDKNQ